MRLILLLLAVLVGANLLCWYYRPPAWSIVAANVCLFLVWVLATPGGGGPDGKGGPERRPKG